jgi:arylformamidase
MVPRVLDLSHPLRDGMEVYPGLPSPRVVPVLSRESSRAHYAPGTEFFIGELQVVGNAGTYLDAPFHRFHQGADLAGLPLDRLVDLPVQVIRAAETGPTRRSWPALGPELLPPPERLRGRAVLFHTGWDRGWETPTYFSGEHPFLTRETAERLAAAGPALVGTDACNVDDVADPSRPAHTLLLGAGIPILENLRGLAGLPGEGEGARFFAAPTAVQGMASIPVRAFALVEGGPLDERSPPAG